jgi:hypothetical protein
MTITATILTRAVVEDTAHTTDAERHERSAAITCAAALPKEEIVDITANTFKALTVPTGAQWVTIEPLSGAGTWTLKGVTGDTGNVLGTALPPGPVSMPITAPSIGLLCSVTATARVRWF